MSGQPAGRLATIPAWVRYGVIAGVVAFACTLGANIAITWFKPADLCRAGALIIPLFMLAALVAFLLLAAAAGFATGRASGPGSSAALAGLLVGVLGGCALLGLIPFAPSIGQRIQDLMALCPAGALFGSAPPPGAFQPPPSEAVGPPTGVAALFSAVISITIGIGLAAGAAALAGILGVATRSDGGAVRPS
ncbi:MAG: hypothetical protein QOH92_293 [Chloroflexota bacterium]|nr:hypothetical protein [Chloroflexota bacterium]